MLNRTRNRKAPALRRKLAAECLEARNLLAGDVTATLAGGVLTIEGDVSANDVMIRPGDEFAEYVVLGMNAEGEETTDVNGDVVIDEPITDIIVKLGTGSDSFTLEGLDGSAPVVIGGNVMVEHEIGDDSVNLMNARINGQLEIVNKNQASMSSLNVVRSTVIGNALVDANGHNADSFVSISDESEFQGDLTIINHEGKDIFNIFGSTIDGDLSIENGIGDTRTVVGTQEGPTIWGDLNLTNMEGMDVLMIAQTDVWGAVTVANGDGNSQTTVETSEIGLGAPVGLSGSFSIDNDLGQDEVTFDNFEVRDDLIIENGAAGEFQGSRVLLSGTTVGNDLSITNDGGFDTILVNAGTSIVNDTHIYVGGGGSDVTLMDADLQGQLFLQAESGDDLVRLENLDVQADVEVDLGAGIDELEIVRGSRLMGSTSLIGGDGIDKLMREVGTSDPIFIAFLAMEDLELDEFI